MLIFKKEKHVRKLVLGHLARVHDCLLESRNVLEHYLAGDMEAVRESARQVVKIESEADALEREIREALLQGGSPATPEDLRKRFEAFLNDRCKGKDTTKLRFVVE